MLGGKYGSYIRRNFPKGTTKAEVTKYQATLIADQVRGKYVQTVGSKGNTGYADFIKEYIQRYVLVRMRGAKFEPYRFVASKKMWENRPIKTISHVEVEDYIQQRLKDGVSKTSINREITSLKVAFRWAMENGYLVASPLSKIKKFKEMVIRPKWLSEEEIEALKKGARDLGDFELEDIIIVAVNSGFRFANLMEITAASILPGDRLQATKTKSGNPYDVPIPSTSKLVLLRLIKEKPFGPLLNFVNFRKRFEKLTKYVGLKRKVGDPNNVTVHTLKHTFVSQALRKGIPINVVSKWANHHSVDFTSKHYGHLCPTKEAEDIEKLNL